MTRSVPLIGVVVGLLFVTAGCASNVSGSGSGSIAVTTSAKPTPSTTAPTTPSSSSSSAKTSSSAPKSVSSAPSSKTSSAAPLGPATLNSITYTSPKCGTATSENTFTLKWATKNGTEVWLEDGAVASGLVGADPKNDGNGQQVSKSDGSNVDNGSVDVLYDCHTPDYYYYLIEVYNTGNSTHSGQVQQVPKG